MIDLPLLLQTAVVLFSQLLSYYIYILIAYDERTVDLRYIWLPSRYTSVYFQLLSAVFCGWEECGSRGRQLFASYYLFPDSGADLCLPSYYKVSDSRPEGHSRKLLGGPAGVYMSTLLFIGSAGSGDQQLD